MVERVLLVAAGGALGAVLRYAVSGWAYRVAGSGFPWGTLVVNLSGCLLIGFLWAATERSPLPSGWSGFLFIGVLGAFTTFSTFAMESLLLARDGEVALALANILASNVGGILLAFVGLYLGRQLFS